MSDQKSFTLIELLIVIGILAILVAAIVVTLNPAQLLAQARDSKRQQDLSALNQSLNTITALDQSLFMGTSSIVYTSLPDSTTTCANWNLPALPSGWQYHCSPTSTLQNTDGTGWIPVNFKTTGVVSLSSLPIDPQNTSSTGLFYTYVTGGSFQLASHFESAKYQATEGSDAMYTVGSNTTLAPFLSGLVGWWPLNEGTGTIAYDRSGYGNNGTLDCCCSSCSSPTWGPGKVGSYSVNFMNNEQPNPQYVTLSNNFPQFLNVESLTLSAWIYPTTMGDTIFEFMASDALSGSPPPSYEASSGVVFYLNFSNQLQATVNGQAWPPPDLSGSQPLSLNAWHFVVFTFDSNTGSENIYQDGDLVASQISSARLNIENNMANVMGFNQWNGRPLVGYLNDARIYNRALSASEISALYNATK